MDQAECIHKIKSAVSRGTHPQPPDAGLYQPTSVMALFVFDKTPELLFIQKADVQGYPWRNQMAFPGGHMEDNDPNTLETALRELKEEMGIQPANVDVVGSLGHFQTINNKDIEAFTGIWNKKDPISYDRAEISRFFKIPLDYLVRLHRKNGYTGRKPNVIELTYAYENVVIWGVTAKILHHLIELLIDQD